MSVIEYRYCDAGGAKTYGCVLVKGVFSKSDIQTIRNCMYCGEFFCPEEIGLPPLQSILWKEFGGPMDEDHDWHTIEDIRPAGKDDTDTPFYGSKEALVVAFQKNRSLKDSGMDVFFPLAFQGKGL